MSKSDGRKVMGRSLSALYGQHRLHPTHGPGYLKVSPKAFSVQPSRPASPLHPASLTLIGFLFWRLLRCRIFHATTDSTYACLSYVWDRYAQTKDGSQYYCHQRVILINERHVRIRGNLFDFLCTARYHAVRAGMGGYRSRMDLSIPFWIDALCIDQSNRLERNHQITHMGQIYSNALTVHAWLGKTPLPNERIDNISDQESIVDGSQESHEDDWIDWKDEAEHVLRAWLHESRLGYHAQPYNPHGYEALLHS